jgi:UDP-N-acetylmuramoylalanine-D-glutamate ligase
VALERAGTLERAVEIASRAARRGDVVLLAPACASFDQFENYEHRGRVFKELIKQREQKSASLNDALKSDGKANKGAETA